MEKSDKELAVELAKSIIMANAQANPNILHKPLSGDDVRNILTDCYSAVRGLDAGM